MSHSVTVSECMGWSRQLSTSATWQCSASVWESSVALWATQGRGDDGQFAILSLHFQNIYQTLFSIFVRKIYGTVKID